jgi:hypothetical protein
MKFLAWYFGYLVYLFKQGCGGHAWVGKKESVPDGCYVGDK